MVRSFQNFYSEPKPVMEKYEPDTSETEEGQEVSIHNVYKRCLRGEVLPNNPNFVYEREVGVLEHPDSDIADVAAISDYLASKVSTDKTEAKSQDGAAPHIASDGQDNFADGVVKDSPEAK